MDHSCCSAVGQIQLNIVTIEKTVSLSTYLGHAKVTDTYWYSLAFPELLSLIAARLELLAEETGE
jgi:hypothetical protein